MKGRAELWEGVGLGLIVEWPSGVVFSNQTGGTCCRHPELEGIFVPLRNDVDGDRLLSAQAELLAYFEGPKHEGTGATDGLDAEDAAFLRALLVAWDLDGFLSLDESRLSESHEAWVHVVIQAEDGDRGTPLFELAPYPRRGVLTWTNSD